MGRKTACSAEEWKQITKLGARQLARELRKKGILNDGMNDFNVWRQYFAKYLRTASRLAIEDCNVEEIVRKALAEVVGGGGATYM